MLLELFKGFIKGRPPLVVFVMCLACFALVLMSFALYIKHTEVVNPDVSMDWNTFLTSFSQLGFCVLNSNQSESSFTTAVTTTHPPVTTPSGVESDKDIMTFSVSMLLSVSSTPEFAQLPYNITYLTGTISGSQLGLKGDLASEPINVTLQLSDLGAFCNEKRCDPVHIYSCVYVQAAAHVFPKTKTSPPTCEPKNDTQGGGMVSEYYARMRGDNVHSTQGYQPWQCRSQPSVRVKYELDPTLTVYLSLGDRSVINLHLMHTSYFLFVMVVTLLIYGVVKGNRVQNRAADKAELLNHTDT